MPDDFLDSIDLQYGNLIDAIIQQHKQLFIQQRQESGETQIDFNKRNLGEIHKDIPSDVARKCEVCGMEFKEHYQLGRHIAKMHPEYAKQKYGAESKEYLKHPEEFTSDYGDKYGKYSCAVCHRFFTTENDIKRHVNTVHGGLISFLHDVTGW